MRLKNKKINHGNNDNDDVDYIGDTDGFRTTTDGCNYFLSVRNC